MKFFGLEINDILVSFVLTLIVSGSVTYFCHVRLKNIENAVTKQNQVLSSFITNVKNEINPDSNFSISSTSIDSASLDSASLDSASLGSASLGSASLGSASLGSASLGSASLASEEAINAVAALENKNTLIEVSDDEIDSSDDGSSSENDDSESEDEEKQLNMNLGHFFEINQDDIKIIDLICIPPQQKYNNNTNDNNSKIIEIFDVNTSDTDSDDESEEEIIVKKITISDITLPEVKVPEVTVPEVTVPEVTIKEVTLLKPVEVPILLPVEELDASNFIKKIHTTHEEGETKLEKLKIEDLRHLAVTKGIGSKDEVKKIKKPELIALLEKL